MTSTNRLKGKHALITGATSGIGAATARLLAAMGCELSLTGRRRSRLHDLASALSDEFGVRVHTYAFDIRSASECSACMDQLTSPVDILINNAGLALGADHVDKGQFEDWDVMIDTNIKGLMYMSRFISADMRARGEGHIINIGSIAGHEAYPGGVVYAATKHAVRAITEATKKDLHGTDIRVSMISPGLVETEFSNVRFHGDDERADSVYSGMKPLTADDVAEVIVFTANRPAHVNIMDTIILPVAQSSAQMVHRNE